MSKPLNLYETSWQVQGAKNVLRNLHDMGVLILDKDSNRKPNDPYNNAIYELLMRDQSALLDWLAMGDQMAIGYRNHQKDKKGKLIKVEAYRL